MKKIFSLSFLLIIAAGSSARAYEYPYTALTERDPLKPLVNESGQILIKKNEQFGGFSLQGIMYSALGSSVVINNAIYEQGDTVGGYLIKRIEEFQVILEKDEQQFYLKWEVSDEK